MRAGREPLSDQSNDTGRDPRQRRGKLDVIGAAKRPAGSGGLVVPVDPEEVAGVDIPEADPFQILLDLRRDL